MTFASFAHGQPTGQVPQPILYHCRGARSFRALWMLEEVGAPYTLELLPFPPRTRAPTFLDINPLGTIPALIIEGQLMTESAAIAQFIAARFADSRFAVEQADPCFAAYLNFLHMGEATLTFPQTIYLRYATLEPEKRRQPVVAEDYRRWFLARLDAAFAMFKGDHACAGRFTAADVSLGYALKLAVAIGLGDDLPERARTYLERLKARPAYQRASAAEKGANTIIEDRT